MRNLRVLGADTPCHPTDNPNKAIGSRLGTAVIQTGNNVKTIHKKLVITLKAFWIDQISSSYTPGISTLKLSTRSIPE